ncbi:hypothetical protein COW86_03480 [Candidatus Kuenenbacteria bacterium CG22_combo_CG10-13_8_21_14_all_39_9]|uniref:Uncharacterized protein n=4 Tax=Parcubacteria group TaxID=1794811 RepID=A0A2H0D0K3_9BACT|nr:MAG: hypothetical protein AUK13_00370 [Candidatus Kuenenbacteria bacterium CG2_30_39_24]PIP75489.1 MAG: hypothetical protein COW86_03480 [Candidatus Kuenenbacteria bacterium CG22_combo_CG10-13_8_21_14_all_39_9]
MINSVILVRPKAEGKIEFPFSLLYVGTALKQAGYHVEILDFHQRDMSSANLIEKLRQSHNIMLGISALSGSYLWVKKLTLKIKEQLPNLAIVIGGHIAISYELLLNKTGVDYVCTGEGEETLPLLIERLDKGESFEQVPNLAFKINNQIITTKRKFVQNFILPDFSLIDVKKYLIHPKQDRFFARDKKYLAHSKPADKLATLMFSRGCLGGCNFCYRHLPGYRQGKLDWCWQYLMKLYNDYGVHYFRIDDELFISDQKWFDNFYNKIKDEKLNIMFRISGLRVDSIDDQLLAKLKDMGCVAINYGIESGSQQILDRMNKRVTVEQNRIAIQKTIAHGIQVMAYIMFGYQGETRQSLIETLDILLSTDINAEDVSIFFTLPLPGSRLYAECLATSQINDEEEFLSQLYDSIKNQYQRYIIQLGQLTRDELNGFEKKLIFLLNLKKIIKPRNPIFKVIKKVTLAVADSSSLNTFFVLAQKVLNKSYKFFNPLPN